MSKMQSKAALAPAFYVLVSLFSPWSALADATDVASLQKDFFHEAYGSFVSTMKVKMPKLRLDGIGEPAFDPSLSRNDWLKAFEKWVAEKDSLSATERKELEDKAEDALYSYYQDKPYARFPYFEDMKAGQARVAKPHSIEKVKLPESFPQGEHTLDLKGYINERFPPQLQKILKDHKAPIYYHDGNCGDAAAFHAQSGYTDAQRFEGSRDNSDSQFVISTNPSNSSMRMVVCQMGGKDSRTRLSSMLGPELHGGGAYLVHDAKRAPIFTFNEEGRKLNLKPTDRVIVGFQGTIWWQLFKTGEWDRIPLTDGGGNEASAYVNRRTGERVINTVNVYGDEMKEALQAFYDKGARRFVYFGTAGGIDSRLNVGDVLLPRFFEGPDGKKVVLENTAEQLGIDHAVKTHVAHFSRHTWVPTLVDETRAKMEGLRKSGAQGLDIEGYYFAEFFKTHPSIERSVILTVSDLPLGKTNYGSENATRGRVMDTVRNDLETLLAAPIPIVGAITTCRQAPGLEGFFQ